MKEKKIKTKSVKFELQLIKIALCHIHLYREQATNNVKL